MCTHHRRAVGIIGALMTMASPVESQDSGFGWRMGAGIEYGEVISAPPSQDAGQTPTVWRVGLDRAVGDRFAVGLDWTGSWFEGRFGTERRHAISVTGTAYVWKGLHARMGAGPGVVTWVNVDGPPPGVIGDVLIGISEGDPSLALTGGVGYDLSFGRSNSRQSPGSWLIDFMVRPCT